MGFFDKIKAGLKKTKENTAANIIERNASTFCCEFAAVVVSK